MDTTAYLTNQGWPGLGHTLHPTGRGIKRPLLISQKTNVLGIGKKKHDAHADQWWARAFDSSLKGLEVGKNEKSGATGNVKSGAWSALDMIKAGGKKWAGNGGLYAGFVRGEGLSGTMRGKPAIEESDLSVTKVIEIQRTVEIHSKKRKRTVGDEGAADEKTERRRKGEKATTTTQADSGGRNIIEDSDITLKTSSCKEKRYQRRKGRRSGEGTSATIVQSVFHLNSADGPGPGERKRNKHAIVTLDSPSALIATNPPENKNGWQDHSAGTLSEHRVEKRRKKVWKPSLA
ncbi:hypothetical protein MMC11_005297 [Xylographa trunciseda]|nr:hypothetical protein [Xylographa trunciseda]